MTQAFIDFVFIVYGSYTDISAYSFYSVIHDLDYRKEWDKLVLKLEVVDTEPDNAIPNINSNIKDSGNELIHWVMKYPVSKLCQVGIKSLNVSLKTLVSNEKQRICLP